MVLSGCSVILSDGEIRRAVERGDIEINPFEPAHLNPCSYDLTLGDEFAVYSDWVCVESYNNIHAFDREIDVKKEPKIARLQIHSGDGLLLNPGVGYLMHTVERVHTKRYAPIIDGVSGLFMQVHAAGEPGFDGQCTLEVTVMHPLRVYPGMRIAQMRFHTIVGEVEKSYAGDVARGSVASRAWKQFR